MDRTLWKINGQTFEELGIEAPSLRLVNGAPDVFSWDDPAASFDADLRWAYDAAIVLTRGVVVVFRGKIRETPRFMGSEAESISYEAHGPWAWLEERAYLQEQSFAVDPLATYPTLEKKKIGRAILGLRLLAAGSAEQLNLSAALADIVSGSGAGVTVGAISGLAWPVPLDEALDLQVTDAIGRLLQFAPDVAQWFDYASEAPAYRAGRRANLDAVSLAVPPPGEGGGSAYVPFVDISIRPAYKLQAPAVVLFFRRAQDSTEAVWAKYEKQAAPEDATGEEPRAVVRTIDLAGATTGATRLTQPVRTEVLSNYLATPGTVLPGEGEGGNAFNALAAFWRRKIPRLAAATITGFRSCARVRVPAGENDDNQSAEPTSACERELVAGGITDWMLQNYSSLSAETQLISAEIAFTEVIDGVSAQRTERWETRVTATSAQTRVYRERGGVVEVGEAAEAAMPGLAAKIWDGIKDLHYEGTLVLVEDEPTLSVRPGVVINLTGSRPEWATMRALVQAVDVDIESGRTTITVGPPHHLGPQELQELFRSNRTRRDITGAFAMVTGRLNESTIRIPPPEPP